jgi:hypothetical protein
MLNRRFVKLLVPIRLWMYSAIWKAKVYILALLELKSEEIVKTII